MLNRILKRKSKNVQKQIDKSIDVLEQIVRLHCSNCGYPNLLCLYPSKRSEDICTKCSRTLKVEDRIAETW